MNKSTPRKRPFGVTLLLCLVLTFVAWGAVRFLAALRGWEVMAEFRSSLSPLYFSVTGAGWVGAGSVLLWSMVTRKPWARRALLAATLIWLIEYWLERGLFFQSPSSNLLFAITSSVLMFGIILVITLHKSTKDFLTGSEAYEQQNENPNSQ